MGVSEGSEATVAEAEGLPTGEIRLVKPASKELWSTLQSVRGHNVYTFTYVNSSFNTSKDAIFKSYQKFTKTFSIKCSFIVIEQGHHINYHIHGFAIRKQGLEKYTLNNKSLKEERITWERVGLPLGNGLEVAAHVAYNERVKPWICYMMKSNNEYYLL